MGLLETVALFYILNEMKRILFLIVYLMSFSAKADMDKICDIDLLADMKFGSVTAVMDAIVKQKCERNNILLVRGIDVVKDHTLYQRLVASFCRFDRNIIETPVGFTCVLYDWRPRTSKL